MTCTRRYSAGNRTVSRHCNWSLQASGRAGRSFWSLSYPTSFGSYVGRIGNPSYGKAGTCSWPPRTDPPGPSCAPGGMNAAGHAGVIHRPSPPWQAVHQTASGPPGPPEGFPPAPRAQPERPAAGSAPPWSGRNCCKRSRRRKPRCSRTSCNRQKHSRRRCCTRCTHRRCRTCCSHKCCTYYSKSCSNNSRGGAGQRPSRQWPSRAVPRPPGSETLVAFHVPPMKEFRRRVWPRFA
jgi:hypothetical protein